jgi:hypothetical protein
VPKPSEKIIPVVLSEESHASTLPTGAVITIVMAAAILMVIYLLFMARGCATTPEPTTVPVIYPETVTQPTIPAPTVIPKPSHKYHPSSSEVIYDAHYPKTGGIIYTLK